MIPSKKKEISNEPKKYCKGCDKTMSIKCFKRKWSNADGVNDICNPCQSKKDSNYYSKKKKEQDFWNQFSPI